MNNPTASEWGVKYRPRHSAWKNDCGSLIVVGLHENSTLALRFQVSVGKKREPA